MISRTLIRAYHENSGHIHSSKVLYAPVWSVILGSASYSILSAEFQNVHRTFHNESLTVAEFCTDSSEKRSSALKKLIQELRQTSDRDIIIYPTYPEDSNSDEYMSFVFSDANYGSLPNTFVAVFPSSVWRQIYPSNSIHFAYSNHSFLVLSTVPVIPDTIWATLTEDPIVKKKLNAIAINDLDVLLNSRNKELKRGGMFSLEICIKKDAPERNCLELLNRVYQRFVESGKITRAERDKTVLPFYQRSPETIKFVLNKHRKKFKVVRQENITCKHPAWKAYTADGDKTKLAIEYSDLLRTWTSPKILEHLSMKRSPEEKHGIISEIFEEVTDLIVQDPTPLEFNSHSFILEKIN